MKKKNMIIYIIIAIMLVLGIMGGYIIGLSAKVMDFNISNVAKGSEVEKSVNDPSYIRVFKGSYTNYIDYDSNTTEYKDIMKKYNDSYKISKLKALSSNINNFENSISTTSKSYSSFNTSDDKIYIEFRYDTLQTLYLNGEEYYNATTQATGVNKQYLRLVIEVNNTEEMTESNVYINNLSTDSSGDKNPGTVFSYRYVTMTHQSELFDYLSELINPTE